MRSPRGGSARPERRARKLGAATGGEALAGARDVAPADDIAGAAPVIEALADDLNTPRALAEMHALAGTLNRSESAIERARAKAGLLFAGGLTGLLEGDPESWFKGDGVEETISTMVADRRRARSEKDFAEADRIRDELKKVHNVVVEDRPDGSSEWRRA